MCCLLLHFELLVFMSSKGILKTLLELLLFASTLRGACLAFVAALFRTFGLLLFVRLFNQLIDQVVPLDLSLT